MKEKILRILNTYVTAQLGENASAKDVEICMEKCIKSFNKAERKGGKKSEKKLDELFEKEKKEYLNQLRKND